MIDRTHQLSVTRQARLLQLARASVYYTPRPVPAADLALMRRLDALHLELPFAGSRMLAGLLSTHDVGVGRLHARTLMRRMGITAVARVQPLRLPVRHPQELRRVPQRHVPCLHPGQHRPPLDLSTAHRCPLHTPPPEREPR